MRTSVSAPGKIHLMGEHAIVHGRPALLAAVNLRTMVTVESQTGNACPERSRRGEFGIVIKTTEPDNYIRHVVEIVQKELKIQMMPSIAITVTSEIPSGYHLGSSAAIAVATVSALVYFLTKSWNLDQINDIAYEAEKKMHGNPSGGDNTVITYGGILWFRKELEWLRLKERLSIAMSEKLNHFFLIDTGRPKESTGEMVAYVKSQISKHKSQMKKLLDQNEEQTKRLVKAVMEENEGELIDAIRTGERTLEGMGVVSKKVIPFMRKIESIGGAVKILGGGGRKDGVGFLLCYHREPECVAGLCKPYNYSIQPITLGEEGARLETSNG